MRRPGVQLTHEVLVEEARFILRTLLRDDLFGKRVRLTEAERANEELRRSRALAAVGQMTAQVAHEIKNPLGSVGLAAQVLEQRLAGDEVSRDVVRRIESSVDHLTRIASELNQFARPTELNLTMVDPAALLDDVLAAVADRVLERQVRLACTRVKPIPRARLDQKEVRKVMLNVLINAVDASEPEGSIEVSLGLSSDTADRLVFSVVDHGEGMDDETAQRLFEPFFTTKARGTGLGMAITRNIVELHGGEISVESAVGEGTTVTVTLPVDAAVRRATTHAEGA